MSRTITVKNFNFSTRKSYGSEFAATAPWGRQTPLALGLPGLRSWQGILMNYIKKHSCFLCLKEHYRNSVVYFTRLSIWGWKGTCIVALGVYIFRASTGNGASVLLRININSCRIINWKQCPPPKTGLGESWLGGLDVLLEFCGCQVWEQDFWWCSKNQIGTGFLLRRWHILMKKQIIINEISCVTSRIFQTRSRENDSFMPHGNRKVASSMPGTKQVPPNPLPFPDLSPNKKGKHKKKAAFFYISSFYPIMSTHFKTIGLKSWNSRTQKSNEPPCSTVYRCYPER